MLIAISGAWWTYQKQVPYYISTVRMSVIPLPQWDETFLGIDLIRDSGDATRTAPTVASELKSDRYAELAAVYLEGGWTAQSVGKAVNLATTGETNVIEIVARATDPATASKLASGFAAAATADRWRTISTQLDARISALREGGLATAGDPQGTNPAATEQAGRLRTLSFVRDGGNDPTLRVGPTSAAVPESRMSLAVTLLLAVLGGLFLGTLAATGIEFLRRNGSRRVVKAGYSLQSSDTYSRNGTSNAHARSR